MKDGKAVGAAWEQQQHQISFMEKVGTRTSHPRAFSIKGGEDHAGAKQMGLLGRGSMNEASAHEAGGCRRESCRDSARTAKGPGYR